MSFFDIFPTFLEAPYSYIMVPVILLCSIVGFYNKDFFHKNLLHPYEVWRGRRWYTLLTSALIHRNWLHLMFNIIMIYGLGYDMFGNIEQEYGASQAYLLTPLLFLLFIIIPNLIQTAVKRNDFVFTAVGASGLSFGLYGFSFLYFPLQSTENILVPYVSNSTHVYIMGFIVLVLLSLSIKSSVNRFLHLNAYFLGAITAFIVRPQSMVELFTSF